MATARKRADTSTRPSDPREDFLDIAGHELRTPITALKGHVQILQRRLRKHEGREADLAELDKMAYHVERINHQLDIYLGASRITRHKYAAMLADTDLVAVVRRLVSIYQGGVTSHSVALETEDLQLRGLWDRKRLEEAVSALLANAVKFSSSGEVVVRLSRTGDFAYVAVSDRGVGVLAVDRSRIFDAYTHGSNVENSGAGLGLHVARAAVRCQGGRIGVRSRRGGGSTFWFTVPFMPPANIELADQTSEQLKRARSSQVR